MPISTMKLKTGSNALPAVIDRGAWGPKGLTLNERLGMVAFGVGELLRVPVKLLGKDMSGLSKGLVYSAGAARPLYIAEIGPNKTLDDWYASVGSPVGPSPYYFSVNIDWRSADQSFTGDTSTVVFPPPAREVNGAPNWPVESDAEIQALLIEQSDAAAMNAVAGSVEQTIQSVSRIASGSITPILFGAGVVLGAYLLIKR